MNNRNGAEVIVDALIEEKVPYMVGLCGHGDTSLLEIARQRKQEIKTLSVHHEQTAGFMADAYFRLTGKPLATFTSVGPGSINIQAAVATAFFDSSAMLAITGNIATSQFNSGAFQEFGHHFQADFTTAMRPYVKRSYHAPRADMLPDMMRHAFNTMLSGRRGPVHLDVPFDVLEEKTAAQPRFSSGWRDEAMYQSAAPAEGLRAAAELLLGAERPVILAGQGCVHDGAGADVRRLAELTGIPVATTPGGKSLLPEAHPLCLGVTGRDGTYPANRATRGADVILAIGTRFGDRATSSWREGITHSRPTKIIHVDIDPGQFGRNLMPTIGIVGSARTVVQQFIALFEQEPQAATAKARRSAYDERWKSWQQAWAQAHEGCASNDQVPIHPDRFVAELQRSAPQESIVVADIGMNHSWMVQQWKTPEQGAFLQSMGLMTMGFGVCGALGAQLAAPGRPVLSVCGDGGFLMHANAVATAVEYDLPVVWAIMNNTGYVSIRDLQRGAFGPDAEHASRFRKGGEGELMSTDFALMAKSMGANGITVERPGDLGAAVQQAFRSGRPTVLDVRVESEVRRRTAGVLDFPPFLGALPNFDPDPL